MKLDAKLLRYMSAEEFRVLTAVEMGMKNHELVPTTLLTPISGLSRGLTHHSLQNLHRYKLVYHENDGYRLTSLGYDYLALKALSNRNVLVAVGRQIGVGKEADVYICEGEDGQAVVLKVHRLGRTSFRTVKDKRDYLQHRKSASWLYYSRLAAVRENEFLVALHDRGFPVPRPVDSNRHCLVMEFIDGVPLNHFKGLADVPGVYEKCMSLVVRLVEIGLVHGDLNEFNLLCSEEEEITLIDLPQMIPFDHPLARTYFERDVECIRLFFERRFNYTVDEIPDFPESTSSPSFLPGIDRRADDDLMLALHDRTGAEGSSDADSGGEMDEDVEDAVDEIERESSEISGEDDDAGAESDSGEGSGDERREGVANAPSKRREGKEWVERDPVQAAKMSLKKEKRKKQLRGHSSNETKRRQKKPSKRRDF